jgi:putative NIF3 family GTP cyclohydrolase 1 type 2
MHLSENHYEKIKAEHINVVNAGHMASDNLGMNLLLDKLEKKADIEIIPCSGFRRVKR